MVVANMLTGKQVSPLPQMFVVTAILWTRWSAGTAVSPTLEAIDVTLPSNKSCPNYCTCLGRQGLRWRWLGITDCLRNPAPDLGALLQATMGIRGLLIRRAHLSALPVNMHQPLCNMAGDLQALDLGFNNLDDLPWTSLWRCDSLAQILVSHNEFTILRNGTFYGFKKLAFLDFSFNQISVIEEDVFSNLGKLSHLKSINLSRNRLLSLDPWFLLFYKQHLQLTVDHNHISQFTNRLGWMCWYKLGAMTGMGTFSAKYNNISRVADIIQGWNLTDSAAYVFFTGNNVDLRRNPLRCICKEPDYIFRNTLNHRPEQGLGTFTCYPKRKQASYELGVVGMSAFICDADKQCPTGCDCIDNSFWLNMTVVCPNIAMKDLPRVLPPRPRQQYRYHLFFHHNNLTSIEYQPYLEFVETLSLSHNEIRNVSLATLCNLTNLKYLYLDHNSLERLPAADPNSTLDLLWLSEVYLGNNSWICDCHSLETKHWFIKNKAVVRDWQAVTCAYPERLRGTNLLLLSDDKFICGDPPSQQTKTLMKAIGGTLTVCLLLSILPIAVLYSKRSWIYKTFKWHPLDWDECQGENKQYDVFVSYASEDEEYVEDYLIPVLRFHGFKVCFHRQHFMPGTSIIDNIEQAVQKSKRTLVFLSDSFTASQYCLWEFTLALNMDIEKGTRRLVVVKDTSLDVGNLKNAVKCYLQRFTYVERGSGGFWDQLVYCLPVNKLGTPGHQNEPIIIDETFMNVQDLPPEDNPADAVNMLTMEVDDGYERPLLP